VGKFWIAKGQLKGAVPCKSEQNGKKERTEGPNEMLLS
jgi:hypothetical protein